MMPGLPTASATKPQAGPDSPQGQCRGGRHVDGGRHDPPLIEHFDRLKSEARIGGEASQQPDQQDRLLGRGEELPRLGQTGDTAERKRTDQVDTQRRSLGGPTRLATG